MLRRIMISPVTADEWMEAVCKAFPYSPYPENTAAKAAVFKHDKERLRSRFQAEFSFDHQEKRYVLQDAGPFARLEFTPNLLQGLVILCRQFDYPISPPGVKELIAQILSWLDSDTRQMIATSAEAIVFDIEQGVDRSIISPRIWQTIERAVRQRRKIGFNYLSPRREDRNPVYHEVAPHHLRYQDGHWYLRGYNLRSVPDEYSGSGIPFIRFRVSYILDDDKLQVLPTVVDVRHRRPPRYLVHYQLAPYIGRGEISHRFPETQITRLPDGSAEVRAVTDDVWDAARVLLSYGEGCVVLGGEELVREMRRRVEGMARNYGFMDEF